MAKERHDARLFGPFPSPGMDNRHVIAVELDPLA